MGLPKILTIWIQRRLLSSGFSISYLKGLEPLMLESIQILDEVLASKCITYELLSHIVERSSGLVSLIKSLRI